LKNNSGASKGWVELHVDSMVVVHKLKNNSGASNLGWRLLRQICRLMEFDLTNLGCDSGSPLHIYECPPTHVSLLLVADSFEVTFSRRIVVVTKTKK
jgi:hypothetical protein